MSSAEVRVKCLNDFGFDKRNVLAGLVSRIEIAIAFDPGASENANVREFNERTTRLRRYKDSLDSHGCALEVSRKDAARMNRAIGMPTRNIRTNNPVARTIGGKVSLCGNAERGTTMKFITA